MKTYLLCIFAMTNYLLEWTQKELNVDCFYWHNFPITTNHILHFPFDFEEVIFLWKHSRTSWIFPRVSLNPLVFHPSLQAASCVLLSCSLVFTGTSHSPTSLQLLENPTSFENFTISLHKQFACVCIIFPYIITIGEIHEIDGDTARVIRERC